MPQTKAPPANKPAPPAQFGFRACATRDRRRHTRTRCRQCLFPRAAIPRPSRHSNAEVSRQSRECFRRSTRTSLPGFLQALQMPSNNVLGLFGDRLEFALGSLGLLGNHSGLGFPGQDRGIGRGEPFARFIGEPARRGGTDKTLSVEWRVPLAIALGRQCWRRSTCSNSSHPLIGPPQSKNSGGSP